MEKKIDRNKRALQVYNSTKGSLINNVTTEEGVKVFVTTVYKTEY